MGFGVGGEAVAVAVSVVSVVSAVSVAVVIVSGLVLCDDDCIGDGAVPSWSNASNCEDVQYDTVRVQ